VQQKVGVHVPFSQDGFGLRYAWIDLVNSQHFDGFGNVTEHLHDSVWLEAFADHWDFDPGITTKRAVRELVVLRGRLRQIAQAVVETATVSESDLNALNLLLAVPILRRLSVQATAFAFDLEPLRSGRRWVRSQLAASFAEMIVQQPLKRLKVCPNPGCRWVFFDETKGNSRRWCNDLTCGNRDKVRRFRERKSTAAKPSDEALAGPRRVQPSNDQS
jgi:predicted RNA-binding Zn ribbon-like protein